MANKVTVKIKTPGLDSLKAGKIVTRAFRKKLGTRVLKDILASIARGVSPVRGQGRYKAYRVDRAAGAFTKRASSAARLGNKAGAKRARAAARRKQDDSTLYPNSVKGKFPSKRNRPVNLKLSGDMLDEMGWVALKRGIKFGLIGASAKIKAIFEGHNEGTNLEAKLPKRQILPTGTGDRFTIKIQRRIRSLYLARIRQLISKSKRR